MEYFEFEQQKTLAKLQKDYDMQKQSNQAAIDAGFKSLNALFLLNGAAATALLSQGNNDFKAVALLFALGAFISIVTLGLAHFFCLAICSTFDAGQPKTLKSPWILSPVRGASKTLSYWDLHWWRIKLAILAVVSALIFVIGLLYTASLVSL